MRLTIRTLALTACTSTQPSFSASSMFAQNASILARRALLILIFLVAFLSLLGPVVMYPDPGRRERNDRGERSELISRGKSRRAVERGPS